MPGNDGDVAARHGFGGNFCEQGYCWNSWRMFCALVLAIDSA